MMLPVWLPFGIVQDIGWTLIHFAWQGIVLAVLLQIALSSCHSVVARHNWSLAVLGAMGAAPVLTFLFLSRPDGGAVIPAVILAGIPSQPTSPVSLETLVGFWFAGVAILSLRALAGLYLAHCLRRLDTVALPPELLERCRRLQKRLAVSRSVRFLQSWRISSPIVVGWLRPVVLIPIAALAGLSPEQLDTLVAHELAHIQRLDPLINLFLVAMETVLFYHPAVWWVTRHVRIEREHCCDDRSVAVCGDVSLYVEALATLEIRKAMPIYLLAANGATLKLRVARLLGIPTGARSCSPSGIAGLAIMSLIVLSAVSVQGSVIPRPAPALAAEVVGRSTSEQHGNVSPVNLSGDQARGTITIRRVGTDHVGVGAAISAKDVPASGGAQPDRAARLIARRTERLALLARYKVDRDAALAEKRAEGRKVRQLNLGTRALERTARLTRGKRDRDAVLAEKQAEDRKARQLTLGARALERTARLAKEKRDRDAAFALR